MLTVPLFVFMFCVRNSAGIVPMNVEATPTRFAAVATLPPGYRIVRTLTIESTKTLFWLNAVGVGLLIVGLVVFGQIGEWIERQSAAAGSDPRGALNRVLLVAVVVISFVGMLVAHELFHGLAFRLFGVRPRYGINLSKGVAYASGENYYVARDAYLVVALAPLVCISIMCILLMLLTDGETRNIVGLVGAANVGGAVGDLWFVLMCLRYPRNLLVRDYGEGAELYARIPTNVADYS
jgi:hypothetical protein